MLTLSACTRHGRDSRVSSPSRLVPLCSPNEKLSKLRFFENLVFECALSFPRTSYPLLLPLSPHSWYEDLSPHVKSFSPQPLFLFMVSPSGRRPPPFRQLTQHPTTPSPDLLIALCVFNLVSRFRPSKSSWARYSFLPTALPNKLHLPLVIFFFVPPKDFTKFRPGKFLLFGSSNFTAQVSFSHSSGRQARTRDAPF